MAVEHAGVIQLLEQCSLALAGSSQPLLEIILTLAQDEWWQVSQLCTQWLATSSNHTPVLQQPARPNDNQQQQQHTPQLQPDTLLRSMGSGHDGDDQLTHLLRPVGDDHSLPALCIDAAPCSMEVEPGELTELMVDQGLGELHQGANPAAKTGVLRLHAKQSAAAAAAVQQPMQQGGVEHAASRAYSTPTTQQSLGTLLVSLCGDLSKAVKAGEEAGIMHAKRLTSALLCAGKGVYACIGRHLCAGQHVRLLYFIEPTDSQLGDSKFSSVWFAGMQVKQPHQLKTHCT